jgi:cell division protein FtsQ
MLSALGLVVTLLTAGIVYAAYEYHYIREINFNGNRHLTPDDLKTLIGCRENDAFFSVSAGEIYRRLRKSPWVKDALVRKDLSGRIEARITESVPIGVLALNDRSWLVDRDGIRLEEIRQQGVYFLPVIKSDPDLNPEAYNEAVILAGILYDKKALAKSGDTEISGSRPEELTLKADGMVFKIGAGGYAEKLEKLHFARNELARRNMKVEYVDVRFADRIVVKPHKDSSQEEAHKKETPAPAKVKQKEKPRNGETKKGRGAKAKKDGELRNAKAAKKRNGGKVKRHVG